MSSMWVDQSLGCSIIAVCFPFIFFIVNIPFIITSLIFSYRQSTCVTTHIEDFSFNLSIWLQVDSYFKILVLIMLLINVAYVLKKRNSSHDFLTKFARYFVAFVGLFTIVWTIVGSVIFWDRLIPSGVCEGQVKAYTNTLLPINFVLFCCYCFSTYFLFLISQ